jgi:hypothetical protein
LFTVCHPSSYLQRLFGREIPKVEAKVKFSWGDWQRLDIGTQQGPCCILLRRSSHSRLVASSQSRCNGRTRAKVGAIEEHAKLEYFPSFLGAYRSLCSPKSE